MRGGEKLPEEEKEKISAKKEVEKLREEIERKGREIQELSKKIEDLRAEISKDKTRETSEVDRMLEEVSEILDVGFNMFGVSSKQGEKTGSRGLIGLIGELARLAEESRSYRKEVDFGGKRGVIDFSVRAGPLNSSATSLAKPRRRVVGRKLAVQPPVEPIEKGEPLVDIFDEGDSIKVVAELPGAEKDGINLELAEKLLTIRVKTQTKEYYKEVRLPTTVDKAVAESTYRNGILEVKLKKTA